MSVSTLALFLITSSFFIAGVIRTVNWFLDLLKWLKE